MSDSEGNKSFGDPSTERKSKKSKSSKKDKKKGEGKSWKKTDSETNQNSDDAKQPAGLKINVVPTDIDDKSDLKGNVPESPVGKSPTGSPTNKG